MIAAAAIMGLAGGIVGAGLMRRAWADREHERWGLITGGWLTMIATVAVGSVWIGPIKGLALSVASVGLGALLVVGNGRVRREARAARETGLAPEPLEGSSRQWRGWLKGLLAGPLGMTAAMAVAFCYATWAPGDPRTRILIGGLLMPMVWALAMTWTLADQQLLRALAVLSATTIIGFALAALQGVL